MSIVVLKVLPGLSATVLANELEKGVIMTMFISPQCAGPLVLAEPIATGNVTSASDHSFACIEKRP